MDSATFQRLINNLGRFQPHLIAEGVIQSNRLESLYDNETTLESLPEPGLELSFWSEDLRFEAIQITINSSFSSLPVYMGELPLPYSNVKTKLQVRSTFGKPLRSTGPIQLPGETVGGWDTYQVGVDLHPEALVDFQYSPDQQVEFLVFSLIDRN